MRCTGWVVLVLLGWVVGPIHGDEIVLRRPDGGGTERIRGEIVDTDEAGNLVIRLSFGTITKPARLLVEVVPDLEERLETLDPGRPGESRSSR